MNYKFFLFQGDENLKIRLDNFVILTNEAR